VAPKKPAASREGAGSGLAGWSDPVGSSRSQKGYWGTASASALVENSAKIAMSDEGILRNPADANRVAPFQPWAKAVYEYRQRSLLKDDPLTRCLPPGGPRQFQMPNGFPLRRSRSADQVCCASRSATWDDVKL